jgi:NADH dehydrogenase
VVVGGGFGGLFATRFLRRAPVDVTLIDRHNYHLFQPLLYQVATGILSEGEIAPPIRNVLRRQRNVEVGLAEVTGFDLEERTVTAMPPTGEPITIPYDSLIVAGGAGQSYFGHDEFSHWAPGMKTIDDALEIRGRILGAFEMAVLEEDAEKRREWLTFVVVGGGPTGVEVAGALGDMIQVTVPSEYRKVDASKARIALIDHGDALLKPFSDKAHGYVAKVLEHKGVDVTLGTGVEEVGTGHARLSDGTVIPTRCVVWGGGIMAAPVAADGGLAQGRGGRVDVEPDLTLSGTPGVYLVGDIANVPGADGQPLPQLGSVALQSGVSAADNIVAGFKGKPTEPFRYRDKGIMAMIGRGAAIAEVGKHHHEVHGELAHMAWLGVHASLMTGTRAKIESFVDWAWDGFTKTGGPHVLDRGDAAEIDWDDDPAVTSAGGVATRPDDPHSAPKVP